MNISRRALLVVAPALLFALTAPAQSTPLRVLASNGMKAVILELQPSAEGAIGYPLSVEFGSTKGLLQKVAAGQQFDVAILTTEAIDELIKENKLAAGTRTDLARAGVGLSVRTGAPKPDIRTPEAMKKTLLAAKSLTYAGDGASRPTLDKMFDRLGIAAEIKPKLVVTQGSGPGMESVAKGQVQIVMTLISEMLPIKGIEVVGPLPGDLQGYISFAGAVSKTNNTEAGRTLIALLKGPSASPVYKAKGLEPR